MYNNVHMFVFLLKGMLLIKVNDAMIIRGSTSLGAECVLSKNGKH